MTTNSSNLTISVVILGKNSADMIGRIYHNISDSNDILLIDDDSRDNTENVCKILGIRYFRRCLNGNFSSQRNFALSKCRNDWVLFLDSDENVSDDFVSKAKREINNGKYNGLYIKRRNVFIDKTMSGTEMGKQKLIRLANKQRGVWKRRVHEYWDVKGCLGYMNEEIIHNTADSLTVFIKKINDYFPIHADENMKDNKSSGIIKILILPILKFINNYIFMKGYVDKSHGLVVSIFMSFHSFLSWSDLWLRKQKP